MTSTLVRRAFGTLALVATVLISAFGAMVAPRASAQTRTPDVIFVATPQPVVDAMLKVANVGPNEVIYYWTIPIGE